MRNVMILFLLIAFVVNADAQVRERDQYTKAGDSDPEATAILNKLRKKI